MLSTLGTFLSDVEILQAFMTSQEVSFTKYMYLLFLCV